MLWPGRRYGSAVSGAKARPPDNANHTMSRQRPGVHAILRWFVKHYVRGTQDVTQLRALGGRERDSDVTGDHSSRKAPISGKYSPARTGLGPNPRASAM
jgi:hypothetical protein